MQELQCVDLIINFLESEKEELVRDVAFEVLFGEFYNSSMIKQALQLLFSYAISLEAKHTLDCVSKWIITNIGNETLEKLFDELMKDHFLLAHSLHKDEPSRNLVNLCHVSPLFASLFMAIILDMLANDMAKHHEESLKKLFNLFETWININPMLPLLAFKQNISHISSYRLNPIMGFIYISLIYPIKAYMANGENETEFKNVDQLASKVHFISLKLIKDLAGFLSASNANDTLILINERNLETLLKRLAEFDTIFIEKLSNNKTNIKLNTFFSIRNDCLDRLAQLLELCWHFGFISISKSDVNRLFVQYFDKNKFTAVMSEIESQAQDFSLLELILNNV